VDYLQLFAGWAAPGLKKFVLVIVFVPELETFFR
jgi:hypothetical protein